jgi:hypothetical protein
VVSPKDEFTLDQSMHYFKKREDTRHSYDILGAGMLWKPKEA